MLVSDEKPGIGGEPLLGQKIKPKCSIYPKGDGSDVPSWVAFDKQVSHMTLGGMQSQNFTDAKQL